MVSGQQMGISEDFIIFSNLPSPLFRKEGIDYPLFLKFFPSNPIFYKVPTKLTPPFIKGDIGGLLIFIIIFIFLLEMFCTTEKVHADAISKIIELQKSIRTMRAEFIQEKHSKLIERPIISKGIFLFSLPGWFVWDYSEGMRVVSDGKRVMLYYKQLKEADIMDISQNSSLPVSFSIENLAKRYHIDVLEAGVRKYILRLKPMIELMPLQEIFITLDEKATPLEVKMIERTGDSSVIKFTNMKVNIMIPEENFSMRVPEGVSVRKH